MAVQIPLKREGGSLLSDGLYRMKIEQVEEKNGPSGHPYLNVRYRVFVNGEASGVAVWDVISLSPAARFKVDQFLDSVGAPEEGQVSSKWFEGRFVWATLKTGEYNGNFRNEVNAYLSSETASQVGEGGGAAQSSKPAKKTSKKASAVVAEPEEMSEEEFPY